jgi:hypothetical protein
MHGLSEAAAVEVSGMEVLGNVDDRGLGSEWCRCLRLKECQSNMIMRLWQSYSLYENEVEGM